MLEPIYKLDSCRQQTHTHTFASVRWYSIKLSGMKMKDIIDLSLRNQNDTG